MIAYLESSAAAKLLFDEPDSDALGAFLEDVQAKDGRVVSCALLETELRRAAVRENTPQERVTDIVDRFYIAELARASFTSAGVLPGTNLRSLDALHVAAALLVNADVMVSYDKRQLDAAQAAGLHVASPTA